MGRYVKLLEYDLAFYIYNCTVHYFYHFVIFTSVYLDAFLRRMLLVGDELDVAQLKSHVYSNVTFMDLSRLWLCYVCECSI